MGRCARNRDSQPGTVILWDGYKRLQYAPVYCACHCVAARAPTGAETPSPADVRTRHQTTGATKRCFGERGTTAGTPNATSQGAICNVDLTSTPDIVSRPGRYPLSAQGGLSATCQLILDPSVLVPREEITRRSSESVGVLPCAVHMGFAAKRRIGAIVAKTNAVPVPLSVPADNYPCSSAKAPCSVCKELWRRLARLSMQRTHGDKIST